MNAIKLKGNNFRHQINTAKGILDTILSVQPKQGGSQGGETRESVVYHLADDMLKKLPKQYKDFEVNDLLTIIVTLNRANRGRVIIRFSYRTQVKESLLRMGALLPMNIFLRQEIDRIKRVLGIVQKTLCDLKLAIDGTIVMSQGLRESLDAMYDARIPQRWQKVSKKKTSTNTSTSFVLHIRYKG